MVKKRIRVRLRPDAAERLTLGDLAAIEALGEGGDFKVRDVIALLEKVLEDDPRQLPIAALPEAVKALGEALKGLALSPEDEKN